MNTKDKEILNEKYIQCINTLLTLYERLKQLSPAEVKRFKPVFDEKVKVLEGYLKAIDKRLNSMNSDSQKNTTANINRQNQR